MRAFWMLSTIKVHVCARCGSERIYKNGHANNRAQRAKCLECGRTFILEPKGPLHDDAFKKQVVRAYQDRMSLRGITRTFGVYYKTIIKWAGEKNGELARRGGHPLAEPKG